MRASGSVRGRRLSEVECLLVVIHREGESSESREKKKESDVLGGSDGLDKRLSNGTDGKRKNFFDDLGADGRTDGSDGRTNRTEGLSNGTDWGLSLNKKKKCKGLIPSLSGRREKGRGTARDKDSRAKLRGES